MVPEVSKYGTAACGRVSWSSFQKEIQTSMNSKLRPSCQLLTTSRIGFRYQLVSIRHIILNSVVRGTRVESISTKN